MDDANLIRNRPTIDRKSIPLAEGSVWTSDRCVQYDGGKAFVSDTYQYLTVCGAEATTVVQHQDAIACLTAAGLNPYAEALERLVAEIQSARKTGNAFPQLLSSTELDAANKLLGRER